MIQRIRLASTLINSVNHIQKLKRQCDLVELDSNFPTSDTGESDISGKAKGQSSTILDLERRQERPSSVRLAKSLSLLEENDEERKDNLNDLELQGKVKMKKSFSKKETYEVELRPHKMKKMLKISSMEDMEEVINSQVPKSGFRSARQIIEQDGYGKSQGNDTDRSRQGLLKSKEKTPFKD